MIRFRGIVASERKNTPLRTSSACVVSRAEMRRRYSGTYHRLKSSQNGINGMPTMLTTSQPDTVHLVCGPIFRSNCVSSTVSPVTPG